MSASSSPQARDHHPRILALETSSECCRVAILRDGEVAEESVHADSGHSENILPLVRRLLAAAGLGLADLDALAYGSGPGAFTGLRLACSVAQGLAFGANLPVVGIGTLEALAWSAGRPRVYAALDARMNEVYYAAYRIEGATVEEIVAPGVAAPSEAAIPPGRGWLGCGSGFRAYQGALADRLGSILENVDTTLVPSAGAVARLAAQRMASATDPFSAQPAYVRQKVALTTAERLAKGFRT